MFLLGDEITLIFQPQGIIMEETETQNELIVSSDGSHTLQSAQFGVTYHSIHGAIQETEHVFIQAGLLHAAAQSKQLNILEIGFGTGLNAFATLLKADELNLDITYTTLEPFPIKPALAKQLNYTSAYKKPQRQENFFALHQADWNTPTLISDRFTFTKINNTLQEAALPTDIDVVYFDAFAPTAQPELWEEAPLQRLFDILRPGGVLVTYCAKGVFKRTLKSIGYTVEGIPGPPRKREMTRATKP